MEQQRAKLADVARMAGVSRATASRAINGLPGTTDAMRRRVREVAAQLGFEPHAAARALATGRAGSSRPSRSEHIEVLIVDPDPAALSVKPFYGRVLTGAMCALAGQDVALQVRQVATAPARHEDPPFGRILINVPAAAATRLHRTRTIALGGTAPGVPFVAPDNYGGGHQAAAHLVGTGRRRVGAVFGPATPCALERKAGFLRAMTAAGQTVLSIDGDFTRARAYAAMRELLTLEPDLDAVFAACDVSAMGVLQALREAGRRVPDDVAVVSFDGSALAEAADLSSVYMPVEEEAASAIRHLLDPTLPAQARLPTTLTLRGSSAS